MTHCNYACNSPDHAIGRRNFLGSLAAGTIAGLGAMGLGTAFIGRVCDDELGRYYAATMAEAGTDFVNAPVAGGADTGTMFSWGTNISLGTPQTGHVPGGESPSWM